MIKKVLIWKNKEQQISIVYLLAHLKRFSLQFKKKKKKCTMKKFTNIQTKTITFYNRQTLIFQNKKIQAALI
jgi:hypothetical protein